MARSVFIRSSVGLGPFKIEVGWLVSGPGPVTGPSLVVILVLSGSISLKVSTGCVIILWHYSVAAADSFVLRA